MPSHPQGIKSTQAPLHKAGWGEPVAPSPRSPRRCAPGPSFGELLQGRGRGNQPTALSLPAAAALAAALALPLPALAADWTIRPSVQLREVYTDNVTLAPKGLEQEDFVTEFSPAVSIRGLARRFDLVANYQLQGLLYAKDSDRNDLFHLFNGNLTGELLEDHLFIDLNGRQRQQNVSNVGQVALDNISAGTDRASVLSYGFSPYWQQRFGRYANAEVRYGYNRVESERRQGFSSTAERFRVDVDSGPRFTRLLWDLSARQEEITRGLGRDTEFRTVQGRLRYILNRQFTLIALGGIDDNEFGTSRSRNDGPFWRGGVAWTPSRRTSVEALYGERFFGSDFSLNISHRTRRLLWTASFSQEPQLTRSVLLEEILFPIEDPFGNPILDPITGDPLFLDVTIPIQRDDVMVREVLRTSLRYTLTRHVLELQLRDETRDFQLTDVEEKVNRITGRWDWILGPRTTSRLFLSRSENDFRGGGSAEYYIADWSLIRQLGPTVQASIGYRYAQRDATGVDGNFTENRVIAWINKAF